MDNRSNTLAESVPGAGIGPVGDEIMTSRVQAALRSLQPQRPEPAQGSLAFQLALQAGPPFVALAVAGSWLFHLSIQAALVAALLAIGICVTYGALLRAWLLHDRERESADNQARLQVELDLHKQEIARTNRRLEVRLRDLSLLFDITRSINSTLELGELTKLLTETIGVALGFPEFAMLLLDESSRELFIAATHGFPKQSDAEAVRIRLGEGAAGRAAERAEIVLIDNVADRPDYLPYRGRPTAGSFLAVPLKCRGQVVGVLTFNRPTVDGFSADEVKLLAAIANQAAMAILNARLYEKTVELSLSDPLTGTANRRQLFQQLELEVSRAQRFGNELSVLMIDIDHFKLFNDRHGHLAGDEVLKAVGAAMRRTVRRIDTVARYGGEEFAILLPQIGHREALLVGDKIRRAVAALTAGENGAEAREGVTVSVGLARFPADAVDVRELVAHADEALYAAKNGGRDRLVDYATILEPTPVAAPELATRTRWLRLADPLVSKA